MNNIKRKVLLILTASILIATIIISGCRKEEKPTKKDDNKRNGNPTCNITTPSAGDSYSQGDIVNIAVSAEDEDGSIQSVELYINNILLNSTNQQPYSFQWDTENLDVGQYIIKAKAIDNNDAYTYDSLSVSLIINNKPTCEITTPNDGDTVKQGDIVPISVNATDSDGSIQSVSVYIDNVLLGTLNQQPYEFQWNTAGFDVGLTEIRAIAYDNYNTSESDTISVVLEYGNPVIGDTVYPGNFLNAQNFLIYEITGDSGFIAGTNEYNDKAKAQHFLVDNPAQGYEIKGGIFWFGHKKVLGGGNLNLTVWDFNGNTGISSLGDNQPCPSTVLAQKSVPLSNVDTSSQLSMAHIELFDSPLAVTSDYVMGIEMSNLASDDEIALVTSEDGDGNNFELTWEQWSNGQWATMMAIYGVDFDIAIFPLLSSQSANVKNGDFIFGMRLSGSKRYFSRKNTKVKFDLETGANNLELEIYNTNGQRIINKKLGDLEKGSYSVTINDVHLKKGTYIYVLHTESGKLAKEISI